MTIPTGLGLTRGIESASQPGDSSFNRQEYARRNDAKAIKSIVSEGCWCGCCSMKGRTF